MGIDWDKMLYNSGDFFLPKPVIKILNLYLYNTKNNSFYINGWSLIHLLSGIILGAIYLYLNKTITFYYYNLFIIHTIWEFWQILIGMSKPWNLTGDSNLIDIFMDTIIFMLGTYIVLQYFYGM